MTTTTVLYILIGAALILNTFFAGLSYMAAFDAIDVLQILGFTPLINVAFPINANVFLGKLVDTGHDTMVHKVMDSIISVDTMFPNLP